MPENLVNWQTLITLSGAAMITFIIVLYTGRLFDKYNWYVKMGTDLYAAFWAFIVLIIAEIAIYGNYKDWKMYALGFLIPF